MTYPGPHGWRAGLPAEAAADVARLDAALGLALARRDYVEALIDPRGALFQRLEFVGDSLLDAATMAALVRRAPWHEPDLGPLARSREQLVSDAGLGAVARERGLPSVRTFRASTHRLADRIEACVGAAWADRGIGAAVEVAQRLVLGADLLATAPSDPGTPRGRAPAFEDAAAHLGAPPVDWQWYALAAEDGPRRRRLAAIGDAVLEAAASTALYVRHPSSDEGELSGLRRAIITNRTLATTASALGLSAPTGASDPAERHGGRHHGGRRAVTAAAADPLQALVGAVLLDLGPALALGAGAAALAVAYQPGPVPVPSG